MEDILQQGGQITLTALGSLAALFLLTKLSGNKQVSQMNLFDYVMGITIGSIAAEMASELESPLRPLWAMVVYGLTAWGIALLTNRSIRVRRFITGKPLILMDGVIYRKNLRRARMDLNEFLMYCRVSGYFDLNQIQTAILEHNGTVTFLPAAMQRPVTPADLSMQPQQELLQTPVVQDGRVLPENLQKAGRDGVWLERKLREKGYHGPEEVLLAMARRKPENCRKNSRILRIIRNILLFLSKLPGQMAAGPCPLQIVAAAVAVHIQHLAAGVQAWDQTALEGAGIELVGTEPSGSDLCLIEAAGAGDGQVKMLAGAGQRRQCLLRGVCQGEGGGEPGVFGRHLAQTAVEGAGEGLSAGELPIAERQRLPAA